MKILFAADISFHFLSYPGDKRVHEAMREARECFRHADFSVLNLENVFGTPDEGAPILKSGPNLISDVCFAEYLRALRPTAVGMANNHAKDYGEGPMLSTKKLLEREGFLCFGAGENISEAYRPVLFEKDGVKAAVIAVCENEFGVATEKESGTAGYSLARVSDAIAKAKSEGALPIIYFHGGHEGYPYPSPRRREMYRHFVDLGAAAVIAMHAHCPQGYEEYRGAPIVYGMGNFFFPFPNVKPSWYYGYMSELSLTEEGAALTVHPYRFEEEGITLLKGEERERFDAYMAYITRPIASEEALGRLFDSWCLHPSRFGYYRLLSDFSMEYLADGKRESTVDLKNNFGCEAHCELLTNLFSMLYEERVAAAEALVPNIDLLQNMEIPKE